MRGRLRDRHGTLVRVAMDAVASGDLSPDEKPTAYGEIVWSWRRDPGATSAGAFLAATGTRKAASPGRARISRKTIARGKPGCLGCTCQNRVHSFATFAHGAAGAVGARLSLRPLTSEGQRDCTTRAKSSRGNERLCLHVIASEAKQSICPRGKRWIASSLSLLAMTAPPQPRSFGTAQNDRDHF
jgi:hypothetical protein